MITLDNLPLDYKNIIKLRFDDVEKLDTTFFNLFYNAITNPADFNGDLFKTLDLSAILHYLKKSHIEYLTVWLPKIENLSNELQKSYGLNDLTLSLHSFVVNYQNELSNHINFEEKVLYNFVQKLLKGVYIESEKIFVLNHFLETHNHAVTDDINTIKKVLLNKDPNLLNNKIASELFYQLDLIQNDLTLHAIIEDEVFIDKTHQFIAQKF